MTKMLISIHFQHFILIFIFLMAIFYFECFFDVYILKGSLKKVSILYTYENVDILEGPLLNTKFNIFTNNTFIYIFMSLIILNAP